MFFSCLFLLLNIFIQSVEMYSSKQAGEDAMIDSIQNRDLVVRQNEIDVNASVPREWKQGDVLEGTIISCEENTAIIEIEGTPLQVKTSQKLGEEGTTLKLKVESISKGEIRLQPVEEEEIRPIRQYDKIKSILRKEAIPVSDQNIEIAQKMIENGVTVEKEIFDKVIQAKKQIDQLINTMTKEEAKELLESPYDIEKISIDVIVRFLSSNTGPKQQVSEKEIKEALENYIHHEEKAIKNAVKALLENELPVTKKNIDSLILVQEKIEAVKTMDDQAIAQFIKRELSYTLNNVYASIFSSGKEEPSIKSEVPYEDAGIGLWPMDYEFTREEIISILEAQKIPVDDEYIEAAEILIKNNIEVDKEKVQAVITLKKKIREINEEDILGKSARLLKENKNPGTIELTEQSHLVEKPLTHEEMKQLIRDIKEIDDETIKKLIKRNIPINLKNLREEKAAEIKDEAKPEKENIEQSPGFITAKRQLEEIRLKMTLEAAVKLNQKIQIDTAPLKEVVEELKALEKEYYGDCLKKAGAEASKENIEQLEALYKKIETVKELDERVLPKVIKKEIHFIIDDLYKEQISGEITEPLKAEAAVSAYEEIHTKPEQRFGDTIRKIENQIEDLLKDQNIEPTKENIRCARILIQNDIDVTEENILHLKLLDEKVTYVGANLHPTIAAEMIKEGFRPDQIPIDEVIEYIKNFEEILGQDVREKLSEFILQMDEDKVLIQEEREGMIGIYRMLHTIEKSNGKVIGWLMKNNMSFTLNNLMEGAKYLARTGGRRQDMDVFINDEFGVIKELKFHEKSIKTQLNKAFKEIVPNLENKEETLLREIETDNYSETKTEPASNKSEKNAVLKTEGTTPTTEILKTNYLERILEDFTKLASPDKLKEWLSHNPNLLNEDLESIYNEYVKEAFVKKVFISDTNEADAPVQEKEVNEFLNTLGNLKKVKQETLILMEKSQIPMNIKNLQIVSSMLENPFEFGESLEKFNHMIKESNIKEDIHKVIKEAINDIKNEKELDEVLDRVKEKVQGIKEEILNDSSGQKQNAWKTGNDIEKIMDIQKQIQKQEGIYQIPVLINNKITNMNIYVLKDRKNEKQSEKDGISAFISMDTEHLGTIKMYIHMDEKNVDFKISGESKEITDYLKTHENTLRQSIENIGYKVIKGQIKEEIKESTITDPLFIPIKKHLDSGFEIII